MLPGTLMLLLLPLYFFQQGYSCTFDRNKLFLWDIEDDWQVMQLSYFTVNVDKVLNQGDICIQQLVLVLLWLTLILSYNQR